VGSGQQEKINVLSSCLKFRSWLNLDNSDSGGGGSWTNVITRTTDVFISLQGRCDISNNAGADRFMSTHNNACCGASGTETFSVSSSGTGADMRNKVQQRSVEAWGLTNRGNKTANFYVLVNTVAPAELAELGFIDHPTDSGFVGNATQQDKMAKYHLFAIQNHYGITAYTPSSGGGAVTYTDDSPAVSANWSTGTSAADKFGADYRFRSTEAISDAATWTINVATGGNYNVYAWWSAGTNRSASASYIMPGSGGSVSVNQQTNGGAFRLLGSRSLAAGNNATQLSCWTTTGFVVVADAVRYIGPN